MKTIITALALGFVTTAAHADPQCTTEPKDKWKDQKAFEENLKKEYKIKKFKVTKTNCYEIYGWNKAGKKVEIYFNPVTGEAVESNIEK